MPTSIPVTAALHRSIQPWLPRESRLRDSALDKKKDSSGVNRKKTAGNEDGSECAHDPLG